MASSNPHYERAQQNVKPKMEGGKEVITVKPRNLNIVWGNDDRYWNIPNNGDDKPAELLQVCWLEVTGSVEINPQKRYEVSFRLSLTPDAFGWGSSLLYIMVKRGNSGKFAWKKVSLANKGTDVFHIIGELAQDVFPTDEKLYFGLYEVWSGKWKGGLKIHDVTVKEI
ncbi:protein PHLOEM PROTEIN 2-LIKE A9-like [Coffea eugenioides]|uniref:Protein PHLOEM PROTEIN 2-LIKE A9 n=1 Tax=Coffea arabica TaxID=13443 RepID=A0A6P6UCD5_COFAR|nr:protein PHLOEM PROTEIN 2-LIKE A9-like [Coffea arabica]XP_027185128.1 protein PHLOEM PROTEIN 2-LIKE A9-like [Coffea eugenioides]